MADVNPEARHFSSDGSRQEFWFIGRAGVKTRQTVSDIKQIRYGEGKRESRFQKAGQSRDIKQIRWGAGKRESRVQKAGQGREQAEELNTG